MDDLEIIILSEVSQTEKNKYICLIYVIYIYICLYVESERKIQINLFQNRNRLTNIENKLMVTKGEGQDK